MRRVHVWLGGDEVRAFDIELAGDDADFWVACDLGPWVGHEVTVTIDGVEAPRMLLARATLNGTPVEVEGLYRERLRPQFHFSSQRGWINDPNGLVYYRRTYHLYYQHNPYGWKWGNMHWGHAVSRDLVHWEELGDALYPDALGTMFSGSAVVDWSNTSGFQTGDQPPLVAMYTAAGELFTQCLAYSNDEGRTLEKYAGNPVLGHIAGSNRDPKVIWHEPAKRWVMALYLDQNDYALFGSPNLKEWTRLCDVSLPGSGECPDFFPIAVDGQEQQVKWLFWGANGNYRLGTFDGTKFQPETEPIKSLWGGNDYAAQTYSDIPDADGRRIQISWMAGGKYPDMPFNQQMSFPRELTLRTTPAGPRLHMLPVRETESLRGRKHAWTDLKLSPGENPLSALEGELWDIAAEVAVGQDKVAAIVLTVRGEPVRYDVKAAALHCLGRSAPLAAQDGRIKLRVLVDRTSIEIFANDGLVTMCSCFLPDPADRSLSLTAEGGEASAVSLTLYELTSAWR